MEGRTLSETLPGIPCVDSDTLAQAFWVELALQLQEDTHSVDSLPFIFAVPFLKSPRATKTPHNIPIRCQN